MGQKCFGRQSAPKSKINSKIVPKLVQNVKEEKTMEERQAKRDYAHILNDMMKDLDGFKINSFDIVTIKYQRRLEEWKQT